MYKANWQEWNSQLPYEIESNWLLSIKEDLACVIQSNNSIGITEVTSNLKLYLELKLEINSQDLAWFANIFYSIVTESNSTTCSSFCDLFIQLTQDEDDLPSDCLQLECKPLYNLIFKYLYPQHGRSYPSNTSTLSSLIKLARNANRFFKPGATREILLEILPRINIHDSANFCTYLGLLTLFLPVNRLPQQLNGDGQAEKFYWVPTLMHLWNCCGNSSTLDMLFLDIFGRLAKYHGSHPERIGWNSLDMASIFSRGTRMLGLSVGSGSSGMEAKLLAKKGLSDSGIMDLSMPLGSYFYTSKTSSFAKIIVYSLSSTVNNDPTLIGTDTLSHFETFMRAVEPFAHPSNSGKWTSSLAKLFLEISQNLHERCIQDDCDQIHLDFSVIDKVTRLVGNVIQMMVFGKDSSSISSSQSAFKYLSWINPDAVIPQFLSAANPSLQGLSETHRTISCLGTLYSIASPLIRRSHYPKGGSNLISLLCLSLPGLDVNDIQKSITTLIFIFSAISNVPLVNSSLHSEIPWDKKISSPTSGFLASVGSNMDDEACKHSTVEFESWLALFIERIFVILENLPQNYGVGDSATMEGNLLETIYFTCHVVFSQLSGELEDMVLRMLFKKAQSSLIPTATEAIGSLCGLIGTSSSDKRLSVFVPFCIEGIKLEIENGAGSISSGNRFVANPNPFDFASMSDASLHWYQSILLKVVANSGPALLKYCNDLKDVIDLMLEKCVSKRGYLWTGQLISNMLESLSSIYPEDFRSHPPSNWNNPDFSKESFLRWGEFFKVSELNIRWHIPSQDEKAFAFDLAKRYFGLCISKIENLMLLANPRIASSDFSKWLSILNHCIIGTFTFLQPPKDSQNHANQGEFTKTYSPSRTILNLNAGFLFDEKDNEYRIWSGIISDTQKLFLKMLDYFTCNRVDDIESVKALLQCIKTHLSYGGLYDSASWIYSYSKTILKAGKDETALPRSILVSRVYMLHLRRMQETIKSFPTTTLIFSLISRLHDFSLSKYAEIRKTAQTALFSALRYHRNLRFHITFKTLNVLKEFGNQKDPDRIKGALYILKDRFSIMGVYVYYWEFTALFIDAILFNHAEEKPSILEMIRQIVLEFSSLFSPAEYLEKITHNIELSKEIIPNQRRYQDYLQIKDLVDRNSENAENATIALLLTWVSKTINWRFESMAIHFLDMIITKYVSVTPALISCIFSKIFEPNPTLRLNVHSLLSHVIDILKDHASALDFVNRKKIIEKGSPEYQQVLDEMFNFGNTNIMHKKYYVDKPLGWILLPATLKVYTTDTTRIHSFLNNDEHGRLLCSKLIESSFWDKFLFFAGEESSKEQFKSSNADFYKRLFMVIQDSCFEMILPRIDLLVSKIQENNSQRLAAELIGGIIRGSKHWCSQKKARIENEVFPLLFKGLQFATMESIRHWLACIRYVLSRRDPSRLMPIINHIVSLPLDLTSTSFLAESKKLWLKNILLQTCSFRVRFHVSKIHEQLADYASTPFQQVRDALGRCFDDCLQLLWSKNHETLEDLVAYHSKGLFDPSQLPINSHVLSIKNQLTEWKKLPYKTGTPSIYSNSCKSVLAWFGYALTSYQTPGIANSFPLMISLLLEMSDFPDLDLSLIATQISKIYPNFLHTPSQLDTIFDILISLCIKTTSPVRDNIDLKESKSWHIKARVLPILQVFYFRHIFYLSKETRDRIVLFLDNLLSDQQVEVRRLASISLSGIVQCSAKSSIDELINRFRANLAIHKVPKRKKNEPITEEYSKILSQRHASVLGLSSLVLAFPYDLPEWMPKVLVLLASCASDPNPISNSINHVFGEFKRTHQDSWELDKRKFSEEDLYIVSDLIYSPGYFA